ncbi:MAG: DUF177 domain-containing protein [Defluviitaleaceae bacterium]|nr:DUF177 domain-containing protein [Defluviitaleaceae bacterium]
MVIDFRALVAGVPQDFECVCLRSLPEGYGLTAACPVRVRGRATKLDASTCVCEGTVSAKLRFECGRCLGDVECEVSPDFHEKLEHAPGAQSIDISMTIDEHIILFIPQKVLCGEDCKGLCSSCGENLNNQNCDCEPEIDPRFDVLKDLYLEGGERDGNLPKR